MSTFSISTANQQQVERVLKNYGHTWNSFLNLQQTLQESNRQYYAHQETQELHTSLQTFRNQGRFQGLTRKLLRQETSTEEQGFGKIEDEHGDRAYINHQLLEYAKQAEPILYDLLVEPQLPRIKKSKAEATYKTIPPETDALLFATHPLLGFEMLSEIKEYQEEIQHPTRRIYVELFINRWFFRFNRLALHPSKTWELSLYRLFFGRAGTSPAMGALHRFVGLVIPDHVSDPDHKRFKEGRNNLRMLYLVLTRLLHFLLLKKVKVPLELYKVLADLDNLNFFARQHYLVDGMRADYEKVHLLPNLARKVTNLEQKEALQKLTRKRFLGFWQKYSQLPSTSAKLAFLSGFIRVDRFFVLEQFFQYDQVMELARLQQNIQETVNASEPVSLTPVLQIGSKGNKLASALWQVAQRHDFLNNPKFENNPKLQQMLRRAFSDDSDTNLEKGEFELSEEELRNRRKKNWRQMTIHDIPPYTKVRRWNQITRLSFDVPNLEEILYSFMPYLRLNSKRLQDRLTLAHCVEFCRVPFRYLTTDLDHRFEFHFVTLGDFLIMRLIGSSAESTQHFFDFLKDTHQLPEPLMAPLLTQAYPAINHLFGEMLREHIPFIVTHRYGFKGGGVNGKNAGIGVERINEEEDKLAVYLSSGKLFYRMAEALLLHALNQIDDGFRDTDVVVTRSQLKKYFESRDLDHLIERCMKESSSNFSAFWKWWQSLKGESKEDWKRQLVLEVFLQHKMFFDSNYPNPYVLPTH